MRSIIKRHVQWNQLITHNSHFAELVDVRKLGLREKNNKNQDLNWCNSMWRLIILAFYHSQADRNKLKREAMAKELKEVKI